MKKEMIQLGLELQSRPFAAADVEALKAHHRAVKMAMPLANALKVNETRVMYQVSDKLFTQYPEILQRHKMCDVKARRDMKLTTIYLMYGLLLNDSEYVNQRFGWWFRTILNAFGFGRELVADAYTYCKEFYTPHLNADQARLMSRMYDHIIWVYMFLYSDPKTHINPVFDMPVTKIKVAAKV